MGDYITSDFGQYAVTIDAGHYLWGPVTEKVLLEPWRIPLRSSAGSLIVSTRVELDSGALHMLVSKSIVQQLQLTITLKCGSIHFTMILASIKRVGRFELTLCTLCHMVSVHMDVLPSKCGLPILIGRDILAQYCIDDVLSVLMDGDGEQLATLTESDVAELAAANDSSHQSDMLTILAKKLQANTSLDELLACQLPKEVITIPTTGSWKVYLLQPRFGEQD
ncbi:hypothetical protein H4S08_004875 [Coemansia sp. RSA 1365]|nr:hypothetical protein H4S08_004875 [Coemansia sp. RSA 1365]